MNDSTHSILLIGESGVGKTHYGAQLLSRLAKSENVALKFDLSKGNLNLEPFQAALEKLNDGLAAEHTASTIYLESVWPIIDKNGNTLQLLWPDYAGEQVSMILEQRRVPDRWMKSIRDASTWLLLIRLNQHQDHADIFSKPILCAEQNSSLNDNQCEMSHQARLIELLQIMLFVREINIDTSILSPQMAIMLTCWDELPENNFPPRQLLEKHMPMFYQYVTSIWKKPLFVGLSALERPLSKESQDEDYINNGPESFGYIVNTDGSKSTDLTLPIQLLLNEKI